MIVVDRGLDARSLCAVLLVGIALLLASGNGMGASPPRPLNGSFAPPHHDSGRDTNGNGLYDFLLVNASITVDIADNYTVDGHLHDSNFTLSVFNGTSRYLGPGSWVVTVFFSGPAINASGVDGRYTVDLSLWNSAFTLLDTDVYTTNPYNHSQFDAPRAEFAPPYADFGLDTDGDGLFNALNVNVSLTVGTAGNYIVTGFLHDASFTLALSAFSSRMLDPGSHTVVLSFPGSQLNASGIDGPYTVELSLYVTRTFEFLDSDRYLTAAYSHLEFEEPPSMVSNYATAAPSIDGAFAAGEWADAHIESLTAIPGNAVPALLLVMNDDGFLYIAYDAVGDTTRDSRDVASISFDTGNDGIGTSGHEDEFVQGGWAPNNQAHYVFTQSNNWSLRDSPFDPSLPNQAGLAGAWGFNSSPVEGTAHRIYEFKIPLALLRAAPGDTLGFFGGSQPAPGLYDDTAFGWSLWPEAGGGAIPLDAYGDLILANPPDTVAPTISITSPSPGAFVPVNSVTLSWTASDLGSGLDHFEVAVDGGAPVVLPADATSYTKSGLADGPHTFVITAFDAAGNSQPASVTVSVDTTPPSLQITGPSAGALIGSATVEVTWYASDAGSGLAEIQVRLDGGSPVTLPGTATSHTFTGVSDGTHTITVTGVDQVGNLAAATATVTVDTTDPDVAIVSPASGSVISSSQVTTMFSTGDATSGVERVEISVDGGPAQSLGASETSHVITSLADGPHTVTLTVFDRAGNSATTTVSFRVDTSFFSPSGPYGAGGIAALAIVIVVAALAAIFVLRRRRGSKPPRAPRSPPSA